MKSTYPNYLRPIVSYGINSKLSMKLKFSPSIYIRIFHLRLFNIVRLLTYVIASQF